MTQIVKVLRFAGVLILIISLRFIVLAQEGTMSSTAGNERIINLLQESSSAPVGNGLAFFIALGAGFLIFRYSRYRPDIHKGVQHDF